MNCSNWTPIEIAPIELQLKLLQLNSENSNGSIGAIRSLGPIAPIESSFQNDGSIGAIRSLEPIAPIEPPLQLLNQAQIFNLIPPFGRGLLIPRESLN